MDYDGRVGTFKVLGLDLGQSADYTAGCLLEKKTYPSDFVGPQYAKFRCTSLRRWPLGVDYVDVAKDAVDLNPDVIVPDFTGVGRPVVDIMRREARNRGFEGKIRPVTIAASDARVKLKTEARGSHWLVPKADLITSIAVMQQRRLLVLPRVPETELLLTELAQFQVRFSKHANVQFGNSPGARHHDDLVIAAGLASWFMLRFGTKQLAVYC